MFPIVLAHGIARFDILRKNLDDELDIPENEFDEILHYFKKVKPHLEKHGFQVFHTDVDFAGSLELRSNQLKTAVLKILEASNAEKVHIIAHSMGGLDARKMIVDLEMAEKVRSLTTIGTPHLGTILADHIISHGGSLWIKMLKDAQKLDLEGFHDLTVEACEEFDKRAENDEAKNDVFYQTYASSENFNDMFLPLVPSWFFIRNAVGQNDGLVPVISQKWKSDRVANDGFRKPIVQKDFPFPADHLNQCGWWDWDETLIRFHAPDWLEQKRAFEEKVRNVYLEIAENLPND